MKSIWNAEDYAALLERAAVLSDDRPGLWGQMSCAQMLRHLALSADMATGELAIPQRSTPLSRFPLKQLILYVLPFPKSAPTAPQLKVADDLKVATELAGFRAAMERVRARSQTGEWPAHPAFGALSGTAWGKLVWKHCDHHLQQFGA